jgi:hypothetical protein
MSPSGCRITAHLEACRRPRPWIREPVGVLPAGYWMPLADHPLPALLLTALASLAGMLLVLLGSLAVDQFSQLPAAVR